MRALILDDSPDRHEAFDRRLGPYFSEIIHVYGAPETIQRLATEFWDAMCLDHDLGDDCRSTCSDPGCGADVTAWLKQHPDRKPNQITIHSSNPAGAKNMTLDIPEAVWDPWAYLPE